MIFPSLFDLKDPDYWWVDRDSTIANWQERESFTGQLEGGFVDAFRRLHPDAKGNYSYWSQRAGNRSPNKGLRLDYFVCSEDLFNEDSKVVVRDSYMDMEQLGSDHGPVVLELEIKP